MVHILGALARDCPSWHDDVWVVDSTPVECGRSRETQQRSERPGWATYGYSASHYRHFWGLRLHLLAAPSGLPIAFALAGAKADERDVCWDMLTHGDLARRGRTLIADKGYRSAAFEQQLNDAAITLIRPVIKTEPARAGRAYLRPFRQIIESVFRTLKAQLGLERHGGRTPAGVIARVLQRLVTVAQAEHAADIINNQRRRSLNHTSPAELYAALTAAIWHNQTTHQPGPARSLIAYDH